MAFVNAPRRDDAKITAMEVPAVFPWRARLVIGASIYRGELCKPCRGKDFDMAKKLLHGRLHKTADENVWQLLETEVTSGACHWTGLMAVYVDDLLVSAEDKAAAAALEAISKVWAASEVERVEENCKPLKYSVGSR